MCHMGTQCIGAISCCPLLLCFRRQSLLLTASFLCQSFHSLILFSEAFCFSRYAFCRSNLARFFSGVSVSLCCLSASLRPSKCSSHCSGISTFLWCLFASLRFLKHSSLACESAMFHLNDSYLQLANFSFRVIRIACTIYGMISRIAIL